MHEDLLGYLLGALEPDEQRRIENELAINPQLRCELERLRRCVEPLESLADDVDPPPALVDRVCRAVESHDAACCPTPRSVVARQSSAALRLQRYSVSDGIVVALVALTAFTLFLPALANSRYDARKVRCQENLREMGTQVVTYSLRQPDHRFPYVPVSGNRSFAGVYAPLLLDRELISQYCPILICPGADVAEDSALGYVPSLREIDAASGEQLLALQNRAGGNYAYTVGYWERGRLRAARNRGRSNFALLLDAPSLYLPDRRSANHGGRGQNIFYEDGHITFVTDLRAVPGDDPLRNRDGFAEAGYDRDDSVVLPSSLRPIVESERLSVIGPARESSSH